MLDTQIIKANDVLFKKKVIYQEKVKEGRTALKLENLENAVITTDSGNVFDADEKAQQRLSRALQYWELKGDTAPETIKWKLADNTTVDADYNELKDAFIKAVEFQSALWFEE
jgi:hypothetical protein